MDQKQIRSAIQAAIIAVFLGLIIQFFLDHREDLKLIKHIDPQGLFALAFLTLVIYLLHAFNVLAMLKQVGLKHITQMEWFRIFIISRYINFHVTQGRILYLGYKLKKDHDFDYTQSISAFAYLTWFYTLFTLLFGSAMLLFTMGQWHDSLTPLLVSLQLITVTVAIVPFVLHRLLGHWPVHSPRLLWAKEKIDAVFQQFHASLKNPRLFLNMALSCFAQLTLYLWMVHLAFELLNSPLPLASSTLFCVILTISKYYSIVPNNLGLTEWLSGYLANVLLGSFGIGIIVSSLIRIVDYLLISLLGILLAKTLIPSYGNDHK